MLMKERSPGADSENINFVASLEVHSLLKLYVFSVYMVCSLSFSKHYPFQNVYERFFDNNFL